MSEIEFICPYCDKAQFIEIEGMTAYDNWKIECEKCNKEFTYRIEYSVEGYTDKLDEEKE